MDTKGPTPMPTDNSTAMPLANDIISVRLIVGSTRKGLELQANATLSELYERSESTLDCKIQSLKFGFPPRHIERSSSQTLQEIGIENQERLLVVLLLDNNSEAAAAPSTHQQQQPENIDTTKKQRPKRKAAQEAEASFREVEALERQRQLDDESNNEKAKKRTTTISNKTAQQKRNTARHFAKLNGGSPARRLHDGAPIQKSSSRTRRNIADGATTTTSLEEGLVASTRNALMRKNWRNAVLNAYEQNQAVCRASAPLPQIVFERKDDGQLIVTYPKGLQGRGNYSDSVDFIELDVLKTVIENIYPHNPEALRPSNLSLLSPRVFWNCVFHEQLDIQASLQALCPTLDWRFLRRRKQQLSAKARENLRQQQQQNSHPKVDDDWERAARAIQDVERAMETMEATFQKALPTLPSTTATSWRLVTPDEEDLDELKECILSHDSTADYATIIPKLGVKNWRELANQDENLLHTKLDGAYSLESIDAWITYAQEQTVDEIMVEICEDSVEAAQDLGDFARSGTPKDLVAWRSIVDSLHDVLGQKYEIPRLREWCDRAAVALEQLEWLQDFVTPIM